MFLRAVGVVWVGLWLVASAGDNRMKVNELSGKCREENGLEREEVEKLRNWKELESETTDERVKCFLKCMLRGLSLMNEAGDLTVEGDSDGTRKHRKYYLACKDVTGTDACDKALSFHNCVKKQKSQQENVSE